MRCARHNRHAWRKLLLNAIPLNPSDGKLARPTQDRAAVEPTLRLDDGLNGRAMSPFTLAEPGGQQLPPRCWDSWAETAPSRGPSAETPRPSGSVVRGTRGARGTAWRRRQRPISLAVPHRACSTTWSAITSRRSARRPRVCVTEKGCPDSSSRSFETSCAVGVWPAASLAFGVLGAASIAWCPFRAKAAGSARAAVGVAWRNVPRT